MHAVKVNNENKKVYVFTPKQKWQRKKWKEENQDDNPSHMTATSTLRNLSEMTNEGNKNV